MKGLTEGIREKEGPEASQEVGRRVQVRDAQKWGGELPMRDAQCSRAQGLADRVRGRWLVKRGAF